MADSYPDTGSKPGGIAGRLNLSAGSGVKFTRVHWAWIGGLVVALLIGSRFLFGAAAPVAYNSIPVIRADLSLTVSATGALAPQDQVDVGAEVSGKIDSILVDFNDRVRKGQVLARINTLSFAAALAQSRATLAQAQATLAQAAQTRIRTLALAKSNAASREAVDTANADYLRAVAAVNLAAAQVNSNETTLSKATIYSPIDGVVLDRKVSAGQTVVAAMTTPVLFTLASDLSKMELDVDIDEADVGMLKPGATAYFTVDAYPARQFAAKLISIHNAPKTVNGVVTYQGVLEVANKDSLLKPGMTATVELAATTLKNVTLVPNTALRFVPPDAIKNAAPQPPAPEAGVTWGRVWTNDGKTLKPHDIRLGATDGRSTVVLSGDLKPGDAAVTEIQGHPWQPTQPSPFAP
ncbi:MAG: efflux RND transporter periplasmic adaptor subunit [Alphaproteobacteria bacterium]|nr:efflux RND transporter periplasmic adaptor subunit [Alphaproteobacteria bacterium]MBL7099469.1 efflux RND transporter periplasmic adaptor subunit [Alphaproteobacteria bacterium]